MTSRNDIPATIASSLSSMNGLSSQFDIAAMLPADFASIYPDLTTYGITKWKFANDLFSIPMLQGLTASLPIDIISYLVPNLSDGTPKNVVNIVDAVLGFMSMPNISTLFDSFRPMLQDYVNMAVNLLNTSTDYVAMLKKLNSMSFTELMTDLTANMTDPATNCSFPWCGLIPSDTISNMSTMIMDMMPVD
jgi:hypothetical protein